MSSDIKSRVQDTEDVQEPGHTDWVTDQVEAALENKAKNGTAGYMPFRAVMARYGF